MGQSGCFANDDGDEYFQVQWKKKTLLQLRMIRDKVKFQLKKFGVERSN
jgi:hypothetical protein